MGQVRGVRAVRRERAKRRHPDRVQASAALQSMKAVLPTHAGWIIDLDRGAAHGGGRIVFEGPPVDLAAERSTAAPDATD